MQPQSGLSPSSPTPRETAVCGSIVDTEYQLPIYILTYKRDSISPGVSSTADLAAVSGVLLGNVAESTPTHSKTRTRPCTAPIRCAY